MEKLNQCPICGSNKLTHLFACKDYVASGEEFAVVNCENCTLQFTNPRPTYAEIGKYYQSNRYISHAGTDKSELGVTYKIYDIVRNINIGSKLSLIKQYHQKGKLLDLGCGLGYFLHGVHLDKTFEPIGADVSTEAIEYVKNKFGYSVLDENKLDTLEQGSLDIITQWHVMEHVHMLNERMQFLKRVLKKDGTMFIAVPISSSYDAKSYKQFWDGYDVPRHLYHFTIKSFEHLMTKHGFKVIKRKGLFFDAPYISMRSEYHQQHSFGFIRGGIKGMVSNLLASFTGNYSSILFVVKHAENQ